MSSMTMTVLIFTVSRSVNTPGSTRLTTCILKLIVSDSDTSINDIDCDSCSISSTRIITIVQRQITLINTINTPCCRRLLDGSDNRNLLYICHAGVCSHLQCISFAHGYLHTINGIVEHAIKLAPVG